jgi:peptide/nickel transport system substrate-binding protein
MPNLVSGLPVISRKVAPNTDTAEFNNGRAAIGTGPYRLVSYSPGSQAVFERNPDWYGPAQPWSRVDYRVIPNGGARIVALRAGDIDVIDAVPTRDVETLRAIPTLTIASRPGLCNIFLYLDHARDKPPGVSGPNGEALASSPLRDDRVREALSIAISCPSPSTAPPSCGR